VIAVYFVYGLAFFCLGLIVALQTRQASELPLIRQLPWLAAFGFTHSLVEWSDMFLLAQPSPAVSDALTGIRSALLIISALILIRFGAGLVSAIGPWPAWMLVIPPALLIPLALLVTYALVVMITAEDATTATTVWSRYLLILPGATLSAWGFIRHGRSLPHANLGGADNLLLGAGIAFAVYAVAAGLIVPQAPYGLAPWLNNDAVQDLTGIPVQWWRAVTALAVTVLVTRALGVFEAERQLQLEALRAEREQALIVQQEARQTAEQWIEALVQITRQIAGLEPLDAILTRIVDYARVFMQADDAMLALWDEGYEHMLVKAHAGATTPSLVGQAVNAPPILKAARGGRPGLLSGPFDESRAMPGYAAGSCMVAPLLFEQETFGALWVTSRQAHAFDQARLNRLVHLSDEAVIAIEHTLMASRLQSLAVAEERSRIAREMHDGLAQILGYLSLEMQTLQALVRRGDTQAVLAELTQARQRIDTAQHDVRENILSLRTTLASDAGLIPSLREYIQEFAVQNGIAAHLITDLADDAPPLAPLAQTQLAQIVHEALANVRKHARAKAVTVRLSVLNGGLDAAITDDGMGFAPGTSRAHFGLQTMRERAESVGGTLSISSHPGEGTRITVWLPLLPH
jgi:signal transduction histidine kinase